MNKAEIKHVQCRIGTVVDGFWGPNSTAAAKRHLRKLMPFSPWPKTDQASLTRFYGKPGDESRLINLSVTGLGLRYEGGAVRTVRCHHKVGDSLHRVLTAISNSEFSYILHEYAGVYNNRPMRGGSLPSLHARGAAIDLDPDRNTNRSHWPIAAKMPIEVMEFFAKEGWISAGAFWSRDAMHFQATR